MPILLKNGIAYSQNFDTLSNVAGSTTNNLAIDGWFLTEGGGGARDNEQYAVDTGASTTGDTYSYGAAGSTERALGGLRSGTLIPIFGAQFTNDSGAPITSLDIAYTGEEWRLGTAARTDQLNFEISFNATDLVTGTWTPVSALNFLTPDTATTGAKNGNAAADRTALSATISSLNIPAGASFWIRWTDTDASGADDGLAIDDFSITAHNAGPVTPHLSISDVTHTEGDTGTVTYTFTVSLDTPAQAGGVTFDIATMDNTATTADGDYVLKSLTGQTIPEGSTSYTFDVTVNSDRTIEPNESFFVNISNVTGAAVSDGQALGTIVNDDTTPALSINDVTKVEGDSGTITYTFTVSLDHAARTGGVTFDIATADGTATVADGDYVANSATGVTIAEGQTSTTFDVTVNGDTKVETNETFTVNVTNVTGASVADGQGTGTITENDVPPNLSIANVSKAEGQNGTTTFTFTVSLDHPAPAGGVTFDISTSDVSATAGSDYVAKTLTSQTIPAGSTSYTFEVVVNGDRAFESDESFWVVVNNVEGAGVDQGIATGTIVNDDSAGGVPFINEFHYDNSGTDSNEGVEIAGPAGTSLAGWTLVLYNGTNTPTAAPTYGTAPIALSGVIPDQDDGYGVLTFAVPGLQNGAKDGFALVDPSGNVVQFLSYEGTIIGAPGTPAAGITSTDVGVSEEPAVGVGLSLQLTGTGASSGDFTWQPASASSFGSVNAGQDFIGTSATGLVSVADASIAEGDSGTTILYLTVHRAGGLGQAASVDWTLNLDGTADASDIDAAQPMTGHIDFPAGIAEVKIAVAIAGDTVGEDNETFHVTLSNPIGNIVITDAIGTGTILNDDFVAVSIMQIQGAAHTSPLLGQHVMTTGIVTQVGPNGYYLQDPSGDGNDATSDAVYVFTHTAPTVNVGDSVQVSGTVAEFASDPGVGLTVTEIDSPTSVVLSSGNPLPAAVIIGTGGRLPPANVIDDDHLASYDPSSDGIDFYESMEGMRVTINNPLVIQSTNSFGETYVVASDGAGATGVSARGGLTLSAGDFNPERIQIDSTNASPALFTLGDHISSVTGVLGYSHDEYEVLTSVEPTLRQAGGLARETTTLVGDYNHLAIATYNLENMDPSDNKYDALAHDIIDNLKGPDILGVQEVQDDNGTGSGVLTATQNLTNLVNALNALDPTAHYVFAEIAPTTENTSGGEPGGNIRNAFIYDSNRVSLVPGSLEIIQDPAFNNSRKPLVGTFSFNGQNVTVVDVHSYSRGGSQPDFGANQPAIPAGDSRRTAIADAVRAYVDAHLSSTPDQQFAVLGDFNGFYYETAIQHLTAGGVLTNLSGLLPSEERYSYQFGGNLQEIDYILVTSGLTSGAQYDSVHINAEFSAASRPTDHDPQVALFAIANHAPANLTMDHQAVDENQASGTLVGTASATDADGNTLSYSLTDDAGGRFAIDAATGKVTTTGTLNYEAGHSYDIVVRASDGGGLFTEQTLTIAVGDVNEAPVAGADAVTVYDNVTTANLWSSLLSNDSDPDGNTLTIVSVDTTGTAGHVEFDAASQTLRYVADADSFDSLAIGATASDQFTYTVSDGHGLTTTATVNVTVKGTPAGAVHGDSGDNVITGTSGNDFIYLDDGGDDDASGGLGNDVFLFGATMTSADKVNGGAGTDQVALQGDYWTQPLTFGADMLSIESLSIMPGSDKRFGDDGTHSYSYNLTTVDENVAAGDQMTVDANRLRVGENFTFNGSAETDGNFWIFGGMGVDTLTGGAKNDVFLFGADASGLRWGAQDSVDGGGGMNQLALRGNYTVTFGADQIHNIISMSLMSALDTRFGALGTRYNYDVTMNDGNLAGGRQMTVDAGNLRSGETVTFDGSAELDGSFRVFGGQGNDHITGSQGDDILVGSLGGDWLSGGAGNDTFRYRSAADSSSTHFDTISGFDGTHDVIDLPGGVSGWGTAAQGTLSDGSFDSDLATALQGHMGANQAVLFTADAGQYAGQTFLVVDGDGDGAYTADHDYVIHLVSTVGPIPTADTHIFV